MLLRLINLRRDENWYEIRFTLIIQQELCYFALIFLNINVEIFLKFDMIIKPAITGIDREGEIHREDDSNPSKC